MESIRTLTKLNLGCGEFPKAGYVNVDFLSVSKPDVRHDLNVFPYPFEDNSFDLIELDHVLEHLEDPFAVIKELHRISVDGAVVKIAVPHFSRGFTHPEHKRGFDVSFPYYFQKSFKGGFQGVELELVKLTLRWFAQPELKKTVLSPLLFRVAQLAGTAIDLIANLSPEIFSRVFCFWVGGFEEINFDFKIKK